MKNESLAYITCPSCDARYRVPRESLEHGRHVRCGKCATEWTAYLEEESFIQDTTIPSANEPEQQSVEDAFAESSQIEAFSEEHQDEEIPFQPEGLVIDALQEKPKRLKKVSEILKARPTPRPSAWRVALLSFMVLFGLILARESIVPLLPQTAVLYEKIGFGVNVRGLVFEQLETHVEGTGKDKVIIIKGLVANSSGGVRQVPRIRLALRADDGTELMAWTVIPTKDVVNPRAAVTFKAQVAAPPENAKKLFVRFFNKSDIVAGMH